MGYATEKRFLFCDTFPIAHLRDALHQTLEEQRLKRSRREASVSIGPLRHAQEMKERTWTEGALSDSKGEGEPNVLGPAADRRLSWIPTPGTPGRSLPRDPRAADPHELGSAGQPGEAGYTVEVEREALRRRSTPWAERPQLAGGRAAGRPRVRLRLPRPGADADLVEPAATNLEQLGEQDEVVDELNAFIHPQRPSGHP